MDKINGVQHNTLYVVHVIVNYVQRVLLMTSFFRNLGCRSKMICCPTLIAGLVFLILFIVFLARRKKFHRIQNRVNALKDKANSWDESEIIEFDSGTKILEVDFNEMTGAFLQNQSLCHDDMCYFIFMKQNLSHKRKAYFIC